PAAPRHAEQRFCRSVPTVRGEIMWREEARLRRMGRSRLGVTARRPRRLLILSRRLASSPSREGHESRGRPAAVSLRLVRAGRSRRLYRPPAQTRTTDPNRGPTAAAASSSTLTAIARPSGGVAQAAPRVPPTPGDPRPRSMPPPGRVLLGTAGWYFPVKG